MKKVLIIAYAFPPLQAIGSQRPYRLAKYLSQYGWEPVVLTVDYPGESPEGVKVIKAEHFNIFSAIVSKINYCFGQGSKATAEFRGIGPVNRQINEVKLYRFIKQAIFFPDPEMGWYKAAVKAGVDFIDKEKVDAIISTSAPVTSHLIARKLKQTYRMPWIADLRDLWTQNHFYDKLSLIKHFERQLELNTLSEAEALVTVTPRFADELKLLHKDKDVFCITNGYDPDDFKKTNSKLTSKFTITYTGILYGRKRDPSLLFKAVSSLIDANKINGDLIEIRFYGHKEKWLIDDIKKYNLNGIVNFYGFIQREIVIEKQKESQLLLLLLDANNMEKDVYPAKVFEYFGARRPIIAVGGQGGIAKEILEDTNAGIYIENSELLQIKLLEYYNEFVESGVVKCCSNSKIENYTYNAIAKKYSEILNGLTLE